MISTFTKTTRTYSEKSETFSLNAGHGPRPAAHFSQTEKRKPLPQIKDQRESSGIHMGKSWRVPTPDLNDVDSISWGNPLDFDLSVYLDAYHTTRELCVSPQLQSGSPRHWLAHECPPTLCKKPMMYGGFLRSSGDQMGRSLNPPWSGCHTVMKESSKVDRARSPS